MSDEYGPIFRIVPGETPQEIIDLVRERETVHAHRSEADFLQRIGAPDRAVYVLPDRDGVPLVFVEVAFTRGGGVERIDDLLATDREPLAFDDSDTAVFYSINNVYGVGTGNGAAKSARLPGEELLHGVMEHLQHLRTEQDEPQFRHFVTHSPMPGFRGWLDGALIRQEDLFLPFEKQLLGDNPAEAMQERLAHYDGSDAVTRGILQRLAAEYVAHQKRPGTHKQANGVAHFHASNGAMAGDIFMDGDLSPKGMAESYGVMARYVYEPEMLDARRAAYRNRGEFVLSPAMQDHLNGADLRLALTVLQMQGEAVRR